MSNARHLLSYRVLAFLAMCVCIAAVARISGDVVLFVGDHEVDAGCAHRAQVWLEEQGRPLSIRSVAAVYGCRADASGWKAEPHHEAHRTSDVLDLARSLKESPGSDW